MGHFYVFKWSRGKSIAVIMTLSILCALLIYIKPLQIYSVFQEDKTVAITRGNVKDNNISLTFNISWGEEKVYDILDVLEQQDIRATFFVSGEWAERHPQILEEIVKGQHEVGMLGYRYKSYVEQDIEQVKKDIQQAIQVFNKLGFDHITYIRPPSGHFNKEIIETIEQVGLESVHWSIHPDDSENPGVQKITSHLMDKVAGGDIVLLHASDSAKQTAEALNATIPKLRDKGLAFVTLSELIHEVRTEEKLIES